MFNKNVFGVDLGSSAVKIYSMKKNRMIIEHNMIAIRNGSQVIAVGNDAFEMYEKNPPEISVDRPIVNGKIADVDEVEMLLSLLLRKTDRSVGRKPQIYFSAPVNMSEIEKRAYYAISHTGNLGNPKVFLADRPICDAISLGIDIAKSRGSMILDIGAQSTEVSVLQNDQVIVSDSLPVGGQQLNESICNEVRREENLLIGRRTARRLKAVLASFEQSGIGEARKVTGIDTVSGLPREAVITSELVNRAVDAELRKGAEEIRIFLERTPPQVTRCITEEGIYLTGGTSRIPGIDRYLAHHIGCRINRSDDYEFSTVKGLEQIVQNKELKKWAYVMKDKP
ncbi:MAG: rod shape-determining protein [Lachnospiraceae bacterium]|nr:rod shape-determining protein [Lachnospiraceae bacterium]